MHEEDARKKGMEFAIASRAEYRNVEGELVRWKFDRVESIYEILEPELKSGAEVFSRFLREPQVRALVKPPSP